MDFKYFVRLLIGVIVLSWWTGCNAIEFNGLHINGFLSQGYLYTNHNDYIADTKGGTFDFNEVGLNFGYQLNDSLRFGAQVLSRNLGVDGNNKFTFGYLFGDYNFNRYIGLRGGKIRIPMGFYNHTRDVDMLRTSVFLPNAVYYDEFYTFFSAFYGAEIYGELPLASFGTLEYELFGGKMDEDDDSFLMKNNAISFSAGPGDFTADDAYGVALRWNTPQEGLRLGYSYFYASCRISFDDAAFLQTVDLDLAEVDPVQVLSAEYTWEDFVFAAEFSRFRQVTNIDYGVLPAPFVDIHTREGWYVSGAYRYSELFEFGVAYSEFYHDKNDRGGDTFAPYNFKGWRKDLTFSTRFDITDYWLVKAEYHIVDGAAWLPNPGLYSDANSLDNIKQKWNMIALKTTFSF